MACGNGLTNLLMTAGSYLLQNSGLQNEMGGFLEDLLGDVPILSDIVEVGQEIVDWGGDILDDFTTMAGDVFPGLADAIPPELMDDLKTLVAQGVLTEMIDTVGEETLGVDDIGVFAQNLASGRAFVESTNMFITSALLNAAEDYFNPITNQVTGAVSAVNKAMPSFARDLANTGTIVNLGNLNSLGNPLGLVSNLQQASGGLAVIETALLNAGISPTALSKVLKTSVDLNGLAAQPAIDVLGTGGIVYADVESTIEDPLTGGRTTYSTPTLGGLVLGGATTGTVSNKGLGAAVYEALATVKGTELATVQRVFGSNISGLDSMQDMLDPSKIFPTSYPSLTAVPNGNNATADAQGLLDPSAKIYKDA